MFGRSNRRWQAMLLTSENICEVPLTRRGLRHYAALPRGCCRPTAGGAGAAGTVLLCGENGSSSSLIIPLSHNFEEELLKLTGTAAHRGGLCTLVPLPSCLFVLYLLWHTAITAAPARVALPSIRFVVWLYL